MLQKLVRGEDSLVPIDIQMLTMLPAASPCLVARKRGESQIALRLLAIDSATSVALARAIYAPTKYVLLDDPLSAVVRFFVCGSRITCLNLLQDSHTSRLLYEKLLMGPLLANRTVVRQPAVTLFLLLMVCEDSSHSSRRACATWRQISNTDAGRSY